MSYKTRLNLFMKALVLLQVCMSFISQPLKLRISPSYVEAWIDTHIIPYAFVFYKPTTFASDQGTYYWSALQVERAPGGKAANFAFVGLPFWPKTLNLTV